LFTNCTVYNGKNKQTVCLIAVIYLIIPSPYLRYYSYTWLSSHSYEASLAIWDHTVLPVTRHKWTHPALTQARQAGTRFTYPGGMEDWVAALT